MREPSGAQWCARYPTSVSLSELAEPFRAKAAAFHAALIAAGAKVSIHATRRPYERGYLMSGAWRISRDHANPAVIEPFPGIDIDWTHDGDFVSARAGAAAMVATYGLAYAPSLHSRHYEGRAVDWTLEWSGILRIRTSNGAAFGIASLPRGGMNRDLWSVGASYGVHKLAKDPPHWSDDGH